jgi:hypothetical protein
VQSARIYPVRCKKCRTACQPYVQLALAIPLIFRFQTHVIIACNSMRKFRSHKTVKVALPVLIILTLLVTAGLIAKHSKTLGYVLFIYARDRARDNIHVAEIKSGYRDLSDCKTASQVFDVSANGKPLSFGRCATNCPIFAESERDCNVPSSC